ncbi:MAG: hypothetical protein KAQ70_06155, partial [Candidatus Heimdallarchaeota archaeon]|nr:hypothetical protein [Candidatus Heimdallarchaeota archaeon]
MKSNSSRIWSTYFLILCISTLVYIEPIMDLNENSSLPDINLPTEEEIDYVDFDDYDDSNPIKKVYIPGNSKTKAFISYNQLTSSALDADGVGLEWV